MPDFTTHFLFGQRVLGELPEQVQHIIRLNCESFNFGCQGPDLLFFRSVVRGKSELPAVGGRLHREKNTQLLYEMKRYIAARKGRREFYLLQAYFYGFLCHFFADKTCHPYIYYHEARLGQGRPMEEWGIIHCKIEADIDTLLYPYYMNLDISEFEIRDYYSASEVMKRSITAMLAEVLETVYAKAVSQKELYRCFGEMVRVSSLFYGGTGVLKGVAGAAEALTRSPKGKFTCHFKGERPGWPVLNLQRGSWHSLWQPEVERSDSVPQLLEQAQQEAVPAITRYAQALAVGKPLWVEYTECFGQGEPPQESMDQSPT